MWYKEGVIHRNGNPAIIYPDGKEEWWTNGVKREIYRGKNDDVVDLISLGEITLCASYTRS